MTSIGLTGGGASLTP